MNVTGKITKVLGLEKGTSKAGKEWQKQSFVVDNREPYNNIFCLELFGDKVKLLEKFKVDQTVTVEFNVSTNEWKGKYFTSLQAWRITNDIPLPNREKVEGEVIGATPDNDLPF